MAEPNSPLHHTMLTFPSLRNASPIAQQLAQKLSSNVLHRAICFSVVIALLSLFPSQSPEFATRSIFSSSWELFHLLLVGIAISYGLFSRRNFDFDVGKETPIKTDNAESYLSTMLHVSSVFDDDEEMYGFQGTLNETKTQTWNSQYHRNDPVVVIANESASSGSLFLPVRSLKSHIQDLGSGEETGLQSADKKIGESLDPKNVQGENATVSSPIPWRSRPETMELEDDDSNLSNTSSFRSSKASSPKRCNLSQEMNIEMDNEFSPPPAPPPPPPLPGHVFSSIADKKIARKSFQQELKALSRKARKGGQTNTDIVFHLFESASKLNGTCVGRSCRTIRPRDVQGGLMDVDATRIHSEELPGLEAYQVAQSSPGLETDEKNEVRESVGFPPPDENDDGDGDDAVEEMVKEQVLHSSAPAEAGGNENEVDKKADEFIAKFRKQMTLQRFESAQRAAKG